MNRTLSSEAPKKINEEVSLKGFVRTRRDHGKLIFLDLRDRSGIVQIVVNPKASEGAYKTAEEIRPEFAVEVIGKVNKRPEGTVNKELLTGEVEVEAKEIKILSKAESLPFDMGSEELNLELPTLLDHRALTLRHPKISAIFKIQETIVESFRNTLKEEGFSEIFVPTIVASTTEGGAEVFPIEYFSHKAYLAQSPQFYKQIMIGVFERVFTLAHAYRAEPSVTTRHLTEYVGLDAEMGFIDSWEELMDLAEKVVVGIFADIKAKNSAELRLFKAQLPLVARPIPRLKLKDAQEIIFKKTGIDHRQEPDLTPEDEREICQWAREEHHCELIFITHYPTKKRPFYTMPDPTDQEYTLSFDLIGEGTEWATGSQRINSYDRLLEHVKKWGNQPEELDVYLQAFRYGMPPEGGFCLGLERITKDILGLSNVREASLFPRDMERIDERLSFINQTNKIRVK